MENDPKFDPLTTKFQDQNYPSERTRNQAVSNSSITYRQLLALTPRKAIDEFLRSKSFGKSPATYKIYSQQLEYFAKWLDERKIDKLSDITRKVLEDHLIDFSTKVNGDRRSNGGIHARYRCIRAFLYYWENETDGEYTSPTHRMKVSAAKPPVKKGVSEADFEKLILAADELRDKAILFVLLDTGVRARELINMHIGDINMLTMQITIQHGKGDKPRLVCFGARTKKVLRQYIATLKDQEEEDPLWVSSEEGNSSRLNGPTHQITFTGLQSIIRRLCEKAGCKRYGLHDFRRAFALAALRNMKKTGDGTDLLGLARLMGHNDTRVTERYLALEDSDMVMSYKSISPIDNMRH
jgi:integrase/recombinase XerD